MNTAIHVDKVHKMSQSLTKSTDTLQKVLRRYSNAPDPLIALVEVLYNWREMEDGDDKPHS